MRVKTITCRATIVLVFMCCHARSVLPMVLVADSPANRSSYGLGEALQLKSYFKEGTGVYLLQSAFEARWAMTASETAASDRLIIQISPEARMMLALGGGYLAIVVLFAWFFTFSNVHEGAAEGQLPKPPAAELPTEQPNLGAALSSTGSSAGPGTKIPQHFAAFLMTFGPGAALGLYSVMAGFYQSRFNNNRFIFIWMMISNYSLYPLVSSAQLWYDPHVDAHLGTNLTYPLRIVAVPGLLGLVAILWISLPQTWSVIFGVGLMTGFLSASATNAAVQLVGAMSEDSLIWCELGLVLGAASPLVVMELLNFKVTSSTSRFKLVVTPHIMTLFTTTALLGSLHAKGVFSLAYDTLQAASPRASPRRSEAPAREQPSAAKDGKDQEIPSWVWWWIACTGLMAFMSVCLLSLSGFFGSPAWAQRLAKLKLGSELAGGSIAWNVRGWAVERGPLHRSLLATMLARVTLLCIGLAKLLGLPMSQLTFICVVSVFHGFFTLFKPIVQSTIRQHTPQVRRQLVARVSIRILFWGVLTGALVGLVTGLVIKFRERRGQELVTAW